MSIPTIPLNAANLDERLEPEAFASLKAGYRVFALTPGVRKTGYFWVCEHYDGAFAEVSLPTFPMFEPLSVSVPVTPNREWGTSVAVADEDTPTMEAVDEAVKMVDVRIRFIDHLPNTIVPNRGNKVLEFWIERGKVVEITEES